MASRFNTRFAFKLAVIGMTVVVILGGLGFLAYRANTQRHITAGDELMARQDYIGALKEYGRAVDKDKSDLSFLAKYEDALMKIRPATPSQSEEYYTRFLGIFNHKLRYQQAASDIHLEYLEELYSGARSGSPRSFLAIFTGKPSVGIGRFRVQRIACATMRRYGTCSQFSWKWHPLNPNDRPPSG